MRDYEVILMDLDDTITDDLESRRGGYRGVCARQNVNCDDTNFLKFVDYDNAFWKEWESGRMTLPEWVDTFDKKVEWLRAQRFMANFAQIDFEKAVELNLIYCKKLADNIVMIENADKFIQYLASKYRLVIATNGPYDAAKTKLKKVQLLKYFEDVVVAEDIGVSKPNKEFFNKLMDRIDYYDTSKMAIIGDSFYSDVNGGIGMGIDTYWFNHRNNPIPEGLNYTREFKVFAELYDFI